MDPRRDAFEQQLGVLCTKTDNFLEDNFGSYYPLHPNRLSRGSAANPSFDGLFATTFSFTLGYGSTYGRGYVVRVEIRTLKSVNSNIRKEIDDAAFDFIKKNLGVVFPERKLEIVRDGNIMKITGDFSLG